MPWGIENVVADQFLPTDQRHKKEPLEVRISRRIFLIARVTDDLFRQWFTPIMKNRGNVRILNRWNF